MRDGRINTFTDLSAWKEGHRLVIKVYKITKNFPKEETYSLIDQMRRVSSSVTANITEGFGRQTYKEKLQFYYMAQGSLTELKNFILIAKDVDYLNDNELDSLSEQANLTHQILQGLIQKNKTFINPKS